MSDFEIGQLKSFQTDQNNLILTGSEKLISVIAIEKEVDVDCWYPALLKIQQASEKFYLMNQLDGLPIDTSIFDKLKPAFMEKIIDTISALNKDCFEKKEKEAKQKLEDSGLW
jgi:hypothetical protein